MTIINDADVLQARVGKLPGPRDLKVIDFLDDHAQRWIASSPLAFVAFVQDANIEISPAGGVRGFASAIDARTLRLPRVAFDASTCAVPGASVGALFLLPPLGETLRINGRVATADEPTITLEVQECYLHCAKALMRSSFWDPHVIDNTTMSADTLLAESRFMALATVDADGRADLSPKGDPAGLLLQWRDGRLWYPDRPGNRRVDSFRNILTQPRIAALALIPGTTKLLRLRGRATITSDPAMCAAFAVEGREPKLITAVDDHEVTLHDSDALRRAALWPVAANETQLNPAEIFAAHVKLSRSRGLQAGFVRVALSIPGLMEQGLRHDYKNNLY